jgi:hypothetical protein
MEDCSLTIALAIEFITIKRLQIILLRDSRYFASPLTEHNIKLKVPKLLAEVF